MMRRLRTGAVVVAAGLGATSAGIGWLYLLHRSGALVVGPSLGEALPLQRLAGGASQPLARIVVAWLPAGLVAGLALEAAGLRRRWVRGPALFAVCLVLLLALGAAADTVTASERLGDHLAEQPHRLVIWLAAALAGAGAALPGRVRR
jgi:hypothetical protein